mmetsp:Transcript_25545/g.40562  ORF Transcript_25545/g.40562 Transcript_25545/m.40562 type:complete len:109 (-) Transcript_25545:174-500(-)
MPFYFELGAFVSSGAFSMKTALCTKRRADDLFFPPAQTISDAGLLLLLLLLHCALFATPAGLPNCTPPKRTHLERGASGCRGLLLSLHTTRGRVMPFSPQSCPPQPQL